MQHPSILFHVAFPDDLENKAEEDSLKFLMPN